VTLILTSGLDLCPALARRQEITDNRCARLYGSAWRSIVNSQDTIFHVIRKATSRTEPIHSGLLGWFLRSDSEFLRHFLASFVSAGYSERDDILAAPVSEIMIENEDPLPDGKRIDLTIRFGEAVIGIEVKTADASVNEKDGQLNSYWAGLGEKYQGKQLSLLYITPFNRDNCPSEISNRRIRAIIEFERFSSDHPAQGRHLNWEQIIALYPLNSADPLIEPIYRQHRRYVEHEICDRSQLLRGDDTRELSEFFGEKSVQLFLERLRGGGDPVVREEDKRSYMIPLDRNGTRYGQIVDALLALLTSDCLDKMGRAPKGGAPLELKRRYEEESRFGPFFRRLFRYIGPLNYVWLQGKENLGLRVRHPKHRRSGVSVVTLLPDRLQVRKMR
jgi:hypothetical protein